MKILQSPAAFPRWKTGIMGKRSRQFNPFSFNLFAGLKMNFPTWIFYSVLNPRAKCLQINDPRGRKDAFWATSLLHSLNRERQAGNRHPHRRQELLPGLTQCSFAFCLECGDWLRPDSRSGRRSQLLLLEAISACDIPAFSASLWSAAL